MLYPTLNQPLMFILLLLAGLASGVIFDVLNLIIGLLGSDKYVRHFFNFLSVVLSFAILFIVNLKFNYGQYRSYVLIIFLISFCFERFLSRFLWTKLIKKCYSLLSKKKGIGSEQGENH